MPPPMQAVDSGWLEPRDQGTWAVSAENTAHVLYSPIVTHNSRAHSAQRSGFSQGAALAVPLVAPGYMYSAQCTSKRDIDLTDTKLRASERLTQSGSEASEKLLQRQAPQMVPNAEF